MNSQTEKHSLGNGPLRGARQVPEISTYRGTVAKRVFCFCEEG